MVARLVMTVTHFRREDQCLLGLKKIRLGAGLWNGFGGRTRCGETIWDTAYREVGEECGPRLTQLAYAGIGLVTYATLPTEVELHYFLGESWIGEPCETKEMQPARFPLTALPYSRMWPNDRYVLPLLFSGRKFTGTFHLGSAKTLLRYTVREVQGLPAASTTLYGL